MAKYRIVKENYPSGRTRYSLQAKYFWLTGWNEVGGFPTREDAEGGKAFLLRVDEKPSKTEVIDG